MAVKVPNPEFEGQTKVLNIWLSMLICAIRLPLQLDCLLTHAITLVKTRSQKLVIFLFIPIATAVKHNYCILVAVVVNVQNSMDCQ